MATPLTPEYLEQLAEKEGIPFNHVEGTHYFRLDGTGKSASSLCEHEPYQDAENHFVCEKCGLGCYGFWKWGQGG